MPHEQPSSFRRESLVQERVVRELARQFRRLPVSEPLIRDTTETETSLTPEGVRRFTRNRLGTMGTDAVVTEPDDDIIPNASNS
jgi:hypothetical protein